MKMSEFLSKFKSTYLWGNILAMVIVLIGLIFGAKYAFDIYTHHGEAIRIPDLRHKQATDAEYILEQLGLSMVVSDTGYVKNLPANCILTQTPANGELVKSGRIVYVVVNSSHSPTISLPDVVDNSSYREAVAKLVAMGFNIGDPEYVPGERDWVYGIVVKGKQMMTGDKISVDDVIHIQVGNGLRDEADSVHYVDPDNSFMEEEDDFEEVGPETNVTKSEHQPAHEVSPVEHNSK